MENNILYKKFLLAVALFIFLPINFGLLAPTKVSAQSDTSVVIQPSTTEVAASPGQKQSKSFEVINRSNFYVNLKLVVKDYRQISDSGKLEFYDSKTEPASSWLIPQFLQIGLNPLETKNVGLVVNVSKDLSAGGHYGAILFEPADKSSDINTGNFGELVMLTVMGNNIKTSAVIKSVSLQTGFMQQGNPVDFNFKMQNTGNTHFDTQGKLVLQDWAGKEIGNYSTGQLTVYPKTDRVFKWRWNGTPLMGIYRAEVLLSDPGQNNAFKPVDGIWFILFPWKFVFAFLLAVAIIFIFVKYRKKIILGFFNEAGVKSGNKIEIKIGALGKENGSLSSTPVKNNLK